MNKSYFDTNSISQTAGDARYYLNTVTLDNITPNTDNLSLNSYKITDLSNPVNGTDAMNK